MTKRRGQYKAAQFIAAIKGSGGIMSTIAERVGCDWSTAKKYCLEYPTIKAAYDDECERVADMAEGILMKSIREGNTQDAKWYLSRIRRGKYTERQEIAHEGGMTINMDWGDSKVMDD